MQRVHHEYIQQGVISDNSSVATLQDINKQFERHYMSVVFFSDEDYETVVPVSSMAGMVKFQASDNGLQYGNVSAGDNTEGEVTLGSDTYPRPTAQGSLQSIRVDFSGITTLNGATRYRIYLNSHRG